MLTPAMLRRLLIALVIPSLLALLAAPGCAAVVLHYF